MKLTNIVNFVGIPLRNLALAVPLGAAVFLGLAPTAQAVPPVTNGLVVWLSADSINPADTNQVRIVGADTFVKLWNDGSGGGRHATQTTDANQPKYIASGVGGKPVLRFTEASASKMFLGDLSGAFPSAASFFAVSTINTDGRYNLFDNSNSDSRWVANTWNESKPGVFRNGRADSGFPYANWPQSGSHVFAMESSSSVYRFVKNGEQIGTAAAAYHNGNGRNWTIGCRPDGDQTLNGDIPELILYNRVLTATEADMVGAYLTNKYALTTAYPALPAPEVPTGVAAAPIFSGAIQLTWPSALGATSYNVSATNTSTSVEQVITGVSSPYNVSGLTNGTTYSFKVSSTNSTATSSYSSPPVAATPTVGTACDILTFVFPGLPAAVISGTNISVTVPYDTLVTSLAPTYTVSTNATGSPVSGSARNFTTPQIYTVTAEDGITTKSYSVSVNFLPYAPTTINVNYAGGTNPGNAWMGGYTSFDVSARGTASQVAPLNYYGSFWNDFNSGGANSSNLKDSRGVATGIGLTSSMQNGPWNDWNALGGNRMLVSGLIASYPAYTNMLALTGLNPAHTYSLAIASLHNSGSPTSTFRVGAVEKAMTYSAVTNWTEGKTHVQFTGLIPTAGGTLTVEAKSTGELVLNGFQIVDTTSLNDITQFTFPGYGDAVISGNTISMSVPTGTNVTNMAPTYTVSPSATGAPVSGTSRNFTTPQTYTITALDNSTKDYTVTVTPVAGSSAKDMLTFGPSATISGTNIAWTVPFGTNLTNLAPTYTVSPLASGSPASGTSRNFTAPQTYTVTAQDSSTQVYTVTVTAAAASSAKDMLSFGPGATISGTNIAWTVPYGTNLTNLAPTYTVSPLATGSPASGTSRNFTTPQTYTVTAQDSSIQVYTVTVTAAAASSANTMLTFGPGATISGTNILWTVPFGTNLTNLAPTYTVSPLASGSPASGTSRNFTAPQTYTVTAQNGSTQIYTASVISLLGAPTSINVNYSGATYASLNGYYYNDLSVSGSATQVAPLSYSGNYWNDFGGGGNNSSNLKDSQGLSTGIGLTSSMQAGPWADWNALGTNRMLISGLIASYPAYTNMLALTGLNPAHTYSLAIASLHNTGSQTSTFKVGTVEKALAYTSVSNWTEGKTHVLFTGLVPTATGTLNVEAKSTGELVLNGLQIVDTTPQNDILSFTFPTYGNATIAGNNISITVPYGTDVSAFAPTYTLSYGATCVSASGSTQNFTNPVHYVVTATDSSTKDYTVTVNIRSIADPEFILTAPANWDGRQTITVQATVTNAALLASTGGTNLNYKWSVSGVAATQTSSAGTMTLTYAQGNGPMTVTLVMDNGGWPTSQTATIHVQQPTNEAWVQRTPDANEKPVDGQFFARDDSGYGKIFYLGTQGDTPDTVYLKVYRTDTGSDVQYGTTLRQTLVSGTYSFSAPILGGLYKYKVVYGTTTGGIDSPLATVSNLICGDAYILQGQSNTLAETPNSPTDSGYYSNDWIRSYGNVYTGTIDGGWGIALRTRTWGIAGYGRHQVGGWGMKLARTLLEQHNMPICLINGAVGGTRIDQHLRNEANPEDQATIYGRLLTRLKAAKLTHGIRAVLWHQGEQDQGREGPYAGDFDYKWYHQNFANVSGAWKQNFPNIKNYYIFQIWPAACGDTSANDMLRETQRTLPYLYSNMRIMSTLGIVPGSGCHYNIAGYEFMANLITPLVEQDHYGRSASEVLTAPDLKKAYFTTAARNEIALEFGQNMAWNTGTPGLIYLDGVANKVASGSVTGAVIKLQLTAPSTASTITYLVGSNPWIQGNLLYGSNGIAALTFAQVPLTTSTTVSHNSWISGKGLSGGNALGNADPDNDGIQNALEYVLGGEPNPATAGSNSTTLLPTSSSITGDLIFTFKRKDASEGAVNLTFQWSTDLTFTTPNTVSVGAVSSTTAGVAINIAENTPDAATDDIVITVPVAKAAGGKLFGRLHATVP